MHLFNIFNALKSKRLVFFCFFVFVLFLKLFILMNIILGCFVISMIGITCKDISSYVQIANKSACRTVHFLIKVYICHFYIPKMHKLLMQRGSIFIRLCMNMIICILLFAPAIRYFSLDASRLCSYSIFFD